MVDWNKPIQTKSGRKAIYIGCAENGGNPIDVEIYTSKGKSLIWKFRKDGKLLSGGMETPIDIQNVDQLSGMDC